MFKNTNLNSIFKETKCLSHTNGTPEKTAALPCPFDK